MIVPLYSLVATTLDRVALAKAHKEKCYRLAFVIWLLFENLMTCVANKTRQDALKERVASLTVLRDTVKSCLDYIDRYTTMVRIVKHLCDLEHDKDFKSLMTSLLSCAKELQLKYFCYFASKHVTFLTCYFQ